TILDPVQRVDAIDDLLERSGRNEADEHGVGVEDGGSVARQRAGNGATAERGDQRFVRQHMPLMPPLAQRAAQLVGVPPSCAEDYYLHSRQWLMADGISHQPLTDAVPQHRPDRHETSVRWSCW